MVVRKKRKNCDAMSLVGSMLNVFMRGTDSSQSCRDGHARIGRDRRWLKKERKFEYLWTRGCLSIEKTCTASSSCSSGYAEVPWFENCSYL